MREVVEPGTFSIFIGEASDDIRLEGTVSVVGDNASVSGAAAVPSGVSAAAALGYEVTVGGTVRNVQAAVLQGVSVSAVSDPSVKAVTDRSGKYELKVRLNDSIVFTLDGYAPVTVPVRSTAAIDVDLDPVIK